MEKKILISDRNKNVREYLRREMKKDGYLIEVAKTAEEILDRIRADESIELLILDPELPDLEYETLMQALIEMTAKIPVILHSYSNGPEEYSDLNKPIHVVEKKGHGIESLRRAVDELLTKAGNTQQNKRMEQS